MKKEKKETSTVGYYKRWKAANVGLEVGKYVIPCIPAAVITGINWDEWFVNCGASLPFGFATLLIAVGLTIYAISKKDEIVQKKLSPLFAIALVVAVWAIALMFLANVLQQMGQMLLWTVVGIVGGASADQFKMTTCASRIEEYKGLIEENCLDTKSEKKSKRKEKAEAEAKARAEAKAAAQEEAKRRATE